MSNPNTVSRRGFLGSVSAGSLVLITNLSGTEAVAAMPQDGDAAFDPDLFVSIATDGTVTIVTHRSEMGTGIRTALPMVVADEMEADWDRVKLEQALGDNRYGSQNTDGSRSIRRFFDRMRQAGATARTMLEQAAAKKWGVDVSECKAKHHKVEHVGSSKSLDFGELVEIAGSLKVPDAKGLKFKNVDQRKYIGKSKFPIADIDDIVTGKAKFGIDARIWGQVYAVIARPPVLGGKVKSFDASKAKAMPGVTDIVQIEPYKGAPVFNPVGGIAVCAKSTWQAIQARDALEIEWEDGKHAGYDTDEFAKELAASARKPGKLIRDEGDASVLEKASKVHEADYFVPHLAHAPMEPPCAVAEVKTDASGKVTSCEIWTATQNPQACQQSVGPALGIPLNKVKVHVTLLGSGFGRKSKPDYVVEAAVLSKKLGKPVHVTWTREDDIQHDYYHTIAAMHMKAAVDNKGMPTAWLQRACYPSIGSTFNPAARNAGDFETGMGFSDIPYVVPNLRVENPAARAHVRTGWLRSVAHIYQAFAVCTFPDELAHRAGRDPVEYFLELIGEDRKLTKIPGLKVGYPNHSEPMEKFPFDIGRLRNVSKRAAKLANWGRPFPKGKGLGFAAHRSFLSYCAHVVEVDVAKDGTVSIPKVWAVIDCGTAIYPDRVKSQMEGAAIMGTTQTRYGQITAKKGRIQEANFDEYQMSRMDDAPKEIIVDIIDSKELPSGVGEVGLPTFAPAMCNAIFAATGKRIRSLPLEKHDLTWA